MKCIVLDYNNGSVDIFDIKKKDAEDSELTEQLLQSRGYHLSEIEYMVTSTLILNVR